MLITTALLFYVKVFLDRPLLCPASYAIHNNYKQIIYPVNILLQVFLKTNFSKEKGEIISALFSFYIRSRDDKVFWKVLRI